MKKLHIGLQFCGTSSSPHSIKSAQNFTHFSFLILIQTSHITTHQYRTNSLTQLTWFYNQFTKISSNSHRIQNLSTHFNPSYAHNLHPRPSSITTSCDASMATGLVNHYWPKGFLYRSPHHVPSILTVDLVDPL